MLKSCFDLKLIRGEDRKCTYGQGFSVSVVIMNMLLFMAMKAELEQLISKWGYYHFYVIVPSLLS